MISVVTTPYNSAPYIDEFYRRILAQLHTLGLDYEILFVDDGSPDNALAVAMEICHHDPHVSVVELSKNFAHHKAMMTRLAHTTGDPVFLPDVHLPQPPQTL